MKAFIQIAVLETRRLVRSKAAAALMIASAAWMFAFPHLVKSDGTADGARELYVHYSLGGVFALCLLALAASAAGSLSREREEKRLQLSAVRPVRLFAIALARTLALTAVGAATMAIACAILVFRTGISRPCDSVISPIMESPRQEAERMYDFFMASPETPEEAKKAGRETVLRLLEQRAFDNYQTIPAGKSERWSFAAPKEGSFAVRLRFTNDFDMRQDVLGRFSAEGLSGAISNITQSVVKVPLAGGRTRGGEMSLRFNNDGATSLMLRPRRDIQLLVRADAFGWNLVRAYVELVSILALVTAFGVFLGAALGRSVAVFTIISAIIVTFVSSDVLEQYPDQLEEDRTDRIGLAITRAVERTTRPAASLRPLAALSADERVEPGEASVAFAVNALLFPIFLAFLSGFAIAKKEPSSC